MSDDNPFEILGISSLAEDEVVIAAYRALARKYHPDLNPGVSAQELNERMAKINWAKAELDSNREFWTRAATQSSNAKSSESRRSGTTSQPRSRDTKAQPKGIVLTDPQVLHLSGAKGASGTIVAWVSGSPPKIVKARFKEGLIDIQRLPASGERAAFSVRVQDDFSSDISDNLVLAIEFVAAGFVGAKAFVSVAPINPEVLGQTRGARIAPARHVSTDARISFGKHRRRTFTEIALEEPGYLEWMLREGAGSHIERECARRALELQFGGTWLPEPSRRHRRGRLQQPRSGSTATPIERPSPRAVPALPDPNRPGGLGHLLKQLFGRR